jgi:hypothetical protein
MRAFTLFVKPADFDTRDEAGETAENNWPVVDAKRTNENNRYLFLVIQ